MIKAAVDWSTSGACADPGTVSGRRPNTSTLTGRTSWSRWQGFAVPSRETGGTPRRRRITLRSEAAAGNPEIVGFPSMTSPSSHSRWAGGTTASALRAAVTCSVTPFRIGYRKLAVRTSLKTLLLERVDIAGSHPGRP